MIIVAQDEPNITTITLNRPEKRNALSIALMQELIAAVKEAEQNSRVLILKGEGPVFCAGLDLSEARDERLADESEQMISQTLRTIYRLKIPTIAAVHGAALAGGAGIMAACDLVIASDECKFSFPETRRGLVAAQVMSFLIRQLPQRHLRELLLFGEQIEADKAIRIGLINYIVPQQNLYEHAIKMAKKALRCAPNATSQTKALIEEMYPARFEDDINLGMEYHHEARISEEAKEGIAAFLDKREPSWL